MDKERKEKYFAVLMEELEQQLVEKKVSDKNFVVTELHNYLESFFENLYKNSSEHSLRKFFSFLPSAIFLGCLNYAKNAPKELAHEYFVNKIIEHFLISDYRTFTKKKMTKTPFGIDSYNHAMAIYLHGYSFNTYCDLKDKEETVGFEQKNEKFTEPQPIENEQVNENEYVENQTHHADQKTDEPAPQKPEAIRTEALLKKYWQRLRIPITLSVFLIVSVVSCQFAGILDEQNHTQVLGLFESHVEKGSEKLPPIILQDRFDLKIVHVTEGKDKMGNLLVVFTLKNESQKPLTLNELMVEVTRQRSTDIRETTAKINKLESQVWELEIPDLQGNTKHRYNLQTPLPITADSLQTIALRLYLTKDGKKVLPEDWELVAHFRSAEKIDALSNRFYFENGKLVYDRD